MLAKRDLGSRVIVRRRVTVDGNARFTDLLGELIELDETHLTVETVRGPVRVPLDEVHRAKRVPDVAGLERASAESLPAPTAEQVGDWLLRAAEGFTGRANSAVPLGNPGVPFPDAVDAVIDFYRRQGLPPQMNVPLPLGRPVARRLEDRGWARYGPDVLVQVIDVPDLIAATQPFDKCTLSSHPSQDALSMLAGRRGALPGAALHVLTAVERVRFFECREGGELLAMARGTVTRRWLNLSFIDVAPHARRRGLARAAVGALARWGQLKGANRAYLQVQEDNTAARALYDSLGFTPHHSYARYRLR